MANIVLGGGIGGLSAAYYLSKHSKSGVKLIEASGQVGGWIKSKKNEDVIFEQGPRTIRNFGMSGENTLRLVSDLQLEKSVLPVLKSSPAAQTRMIYADKKFCVLPNKVSDAFKIIPPFKRPLILAAFKDLITPKKVGTDDSLYNFVARRFGKDIAEYIISPLICGIVAGDAKELSVKLIFRNQYDFEQKYRSVLLGSVKSARSKETYEELKKNAEEQDTYNSELNKRARIEKWAVWSLRDGLETLPKALNKYLENESNVELNLNSECKKIDFKGNSVLLTLGNGKTEMAERLYCSLPSKILAKLLPDEHSFLKKELSTIPYVTVGVVNLAFESNIVPAEAFGYLIPPKEKSPVLGVTFDTCCFAQGGNTVITVMMGGRWFGEHFGENPEERNLLEIAINHVKKTFPTDKDPFSSNVSVLRNCIPQYLVGHYEKIERINQYISAQRLPISLIGNSYQGVGVNDVIYTAKQSVLKTT